MQTPFQARTEAAIEAAKKELAKIKSYQYSFTVQLLDPEMIFRSMAFTTFVSTWLVRFVDPKKTHPSPLVQYVFVTALGENGIAEFFVEFLYQKTYR